MKRIFNINSPCGKLMADNSLSPTVTRSLSLTPPSLPRYLIASDSSEHSHRYTDYKVLSISSFFLKTLSIVYELIIVDYIINNNFNYSTIELDNFSLRSMNLHKPTNHRR